MMIKKSLAKIFDRVNLAGLRCAIKGDPGVGEIKEALYRQKEIDSSKTAHTDHA